MITPVSGVTADRGYHLKVCTDAETDLTGTDVPLNTAGAAKTLITTAATSAANAAGAPPQKPAPAATATGISATTTARQAPAPDSSSKHEKITYKVTVGELDEADKKFAEKDEERSIRRHWTNIAFYLMGSLSIVLPVLFLSKFLSSLIIHTFPRLSHRDSSRCIRVFNERQERYFQLESYAGCHQSSHLGMAYRVCGCGRPSVQGICHLESRKGY
jgi:hypothetical protein